MKGPQQRKRVLDRVSTLKAKKDRKFSGLTRFQNVGWSKAEL